MLSPLRCRCQINIWSKYHFLCSRSLSFSRSSSAGETPYPFPSHNRPTPHQIFHLPHGASQADIKARYYELVRIHHPDSIHGRSIPPRLRHARFQSITAAYDALRGKRASSNVDPYTEEILRRKRAYHAHYGHRPRAEHAYYGGRHNWHASADDRWKDRIILAVGITALVAGIAPGLYMFPTSMERRHQAAVAGLAQARSEAREVGDERMRELRKRAQEIRTSRTER
ncbi:J domain-containing protein [Pleurotus pulmonarius]